MTRVHLTISGRVQGVYFRQTTRLKAEELGLTGWVRNRLGGTVEVVAEGEAAAVHDLVCWCREGPPMARVDYVEVIAEDAVGLQEGFLVRPTE